ncbi:Uncharacterised protein [Bordetella pertussis]|nr:Uncharacterised protein [Bordetella pertussis]
MRALGPTSRCIRPACWFSRTPCLPGRSRSTITVRPRMAATCGWW